MPSSRACLPSGESASDRSLIGRAGANIRWSRTPERERSAATAPARNAFLARFEKQVDPDGKLPPDERARLAESALKAHMQLLARKSRKARAGRKVAAAPRSDAA